MTWKQATKHNDILYNDNGGDNDDRERYWNNANGNDHYHNKTIRMIIYTRQFLITQAYCNSLQDRWPLVKIAIYIK